MKGKRPLPEHSVIVHFRYGRPDLDELFAVEERLESAIVDAGVGDFDGNDIAADGSDGSFYMYGPDADRLFTAIRPALDSTPFMRGATVQLRYGAFKEGAREVQVTIGRSQ